MAGIGVRCQARCPNLYRSTEVKNGTIGAYEITICLDITIPPPMATLVQGAVRVRNASLHFHGGGSLPKLH
jgi:hypothetical protein